MKRTKLLSSIIIGVTSLVGTVAVACGNDKVPAQKKDGVETGVYYYDSIGGIVIELLDRLPQEGEEVTTENGIRLVVDEVEKNRIDKVHIYLPQEDPDIETENES